MKSIKTRVVLAGALLAASVARGVAPEGDDYLVIDLSGGVEAESFPVNSLASVPAGGWTDEYRTTKLVLRKCAAGSDVLGRYLITKGFYAGVFEVTQKQWELVMGAWPMDPRSASRGTGDTYPAYFVSYNDIRGASEGAGWPASAAVDDTSFVGVIRRKTGIADFDLPTEAQWEYACRAGATTDYNLGASAEDLDAAGWYVDNAEGTTHMVGAKTPNAWGLYDMHGNMWEWTLDRAGAVLAGQDPVGADEGSNRVVRGGGWDGDASTCVASNRNPRASTYRSSVFGFRLFCATATISVDPAPEDLFGDFADVTKDGDVTIVTLKRDVEGPILIPDNLGAVTLDLNGYDIVGKDGLNGDGSTPGTDGSPAILIVASGRTGEPTHVDVVISRSDAGGGVAGGKGGAGAPPGAGGSAVQVSEGTKDGVKMDVGDGISLVGGSGGFDSAGNGVGGNGGNGVTGDVGTNDGSITGGVGGTSENGVPGVGGVGVTGEIAANNGTVSDGEVGGNTPIALVGRYVRLDLVDLGMSIPSDVDYASGDKVKVKVEGLAKGLKLVSTPVYKDPNAKPKVVAGYVHTLEGVPTETVDFATQPMFARVTVTYKDKSRGKAEQVQALRLAIVKPDPVGTLQGALGVVFPSTEAAALWPDAVVHPKEWSFKGWPAGIKYNKTDKPIATKGVTVAEAYCIYGTPTKAGVFTVVATHTFKPADGKKTVKETFEAVFEVWGAEEQTFRYVDQAHVATETKELGADVKSVSGQPSGVKFTAKAIAADAAKGTPAYPAQSLYGTPTKAGIYAVTVAKADKTRETFLWKVLDGENAGVELVVDDATLETAEATYEVVQGSVRKWSLVVADGAKVTAAKLPSGMKLVQDKETKTYTIEGTPTQAGNSVVELKVVRNGVTKIERFAVVVGKNPFTGTWSGLQLDACERASMTLDVVVSAGGQVKATLVENGVKTSATVKNLETNAHVAKLVLPADKKNPAAVDRVLELDFEAGTATVAGAFEFSLCAKGEISTSEVRTVVLEEDVGTTRTAFACLTYTYNAQKALFTVTGKLWDDTPVKASVPVLDDQGDLWCAPFLVTGKSDDKPVYSICLSAEDDAVCVKENGKTLDVVVAAGSGFSKAALKGLKTFGGATRDTEVLLDFGEGTLSVGLVAELAVSGKTTVAATGRPAVRATDKETGWTYVCEMLPFVNEQGELHFRGFVTATKKGNSTRYGLAETK